MEFKHRNSQSTYSMPKEIFKMIDEMYKARIARDEKASRSGVVAEAITKLWELEHAKDSNT